MRVEFLRQIQIRIHGMQAVHAFGDVTRTFDSHLAEHGLQSAFMQALLHAFLSIASLHRRCRLARTTHLDMRFQKLPHQFAATPLEFSFQIAFSQAAGLLRAQKRFDRAEAFTRFRKGVAIHCRLGRHGSVLPQPWRGIPR